MGSNLYSPQNNGFIQGLSYLVTPILTKTKEVEGTIEDEESVSVLANKAALDTFLGLGFNLRMLGRTPGKEGKRDNVFDVAISENGGALSMIGDLVGTGQYGFGYLSQRQGGPLVENQRNLLDFQKDYLGLSADKTLVKTADGQTLNVFGENKLTGKEMKSLSVGEEFEGSLLSKGVLDHLNNQEQVVQVLGSFEGGDKLFTATIAPTLSKEDALAKKGTKADVNGFVNAGGVSFISAMLTGEETEDGETKNQKNTIQFRLFFA